MVRVGHEPGPFGMVNLGGEGVRSGVFVGVQRGLVGGPKGMGRQEDDGLPSEVFVAERGQIIEVQRRIRWWARVCPWCRRGAAGP